MIVLILVLINSIISVGGNGVPFILWSKNKKSENAELLGISASLNKSANPCENFYEYTCGGWIEKSVQPESQPFWNQWQSVTQKLLQRIETILKIKEPIPKHLIKAQNMYNVCIQKKTKAKYLQNLRTFLNDFGGLPLVMQSWNSSGNNWANNVAKITRTLGVYPLLKMHVFIDLQNTSQRSLYIEHGELILPDTILVNPENHKHYIKAYLIWILEVIHHIFPNKTHSSLQAEVAEIINFEMELAKLNQYKEKTEKITISKLSEEFLLNWIEIFSKLFYFTSIKMHPNDTVIFRCRKYLSKLLYLISNTPAKTVKNYILWSALKSLSRDTTKYMKKLSFMMDNVIFGVKEDLSWTHECINRVNTYMDIVLLATYSKLYLPSHVLNDVNLMTKTIKSELIEILKRNTWLQTKTLNLAIEKITSLKYIIAYPEQLNNDTLLEIIFSEVEITNNHFTNIIQLKSFKMKNHFQKLNQPVNFELPESMFEVNAYYNILQNSIFIPLGMLEPPFYDIHRPRVHNYGALGSLIGHEISHALDVIGRHADKNGNVHNWWPARDAAKYDETVTCFKQQYDDYNISGTETLGENIADNVGLHISYNAFKNLKNQFHSSDLKEFSVDQLFFISFSQMWCERPPKNILANEDEYAPVKTRVLGTLQNNKEFQEAFHCKNNAKKCKLW